MVRIKSNVDQLAKQLQKQAEELARARVEEIVTSQYCSEHGEFAKLAEVVREDDQISFRFAVCCEELHARVKLTLSNLGAQ